MWKLVRRTNKHATHFILSQELFSLVSSIIICVPFVLVKATMYINLFQRVWCIGQSSQSVKLDQVFKLCLTTMGVEKKSHQYFCVVVRGIVDVLAHYCGLTFITCCERNCGHLCALLITSILADVKRVW